MKQNININNIKEKKMSIPIENQSTAAYYDIKGLKPESRVPIFSFITKNISALNLCIG